MSDTHYESVEVGQRFSQTWFTLRFLQICFTLRFSQIICLGVPTSTHLPFCFLNSYWNSKIQVCTSLSLDAVLPREIKFCHCLSITLLSSSSTSFFVSLFCALSLSIFPNQPPHIFWQNNSIFLGSFLNAFSISTFWVYWAQFFSDLELREAPLNLAPPLFGHCP